MICKTLKLRRILKSFRALKSFALGVLLIAGVESACGSIVYKGETLPTTKSEATTADYVTLSSGGNYYEDSPLGTNAYGRTSAADRGSLHWSNGEPASSGKSYFSGSGLRSVTGSSTWNHDPSQNQCLFAGNRLVLYGCSVYWKTKAPYYMEFNELYALTGACFENNNEAAIGDMKIAGKVIVLGSENYPVTFRPGNTTYRAGFNFACTLEAPETAYMKVCPITSKSVLRGYVKLTGTTDEFLGTLTVDSNDLYVASCGLENVKALRLTNMAALSPLAASGETVTVANLSADATSAIVLSSTNLLELTGTVSLDPAVKVSVAKPDTWPTSSERVEVLRVPVGTQIESHLAENPVTAGDGFVYSLFVETDDQYERVYCQLGVQQTSTDILEAEGALQSSMTNDLAWSDSHAPRENHDYVSFMAGLRTLHENTTSDKLTMPVFPGRSLTICSNTLFTICQSYFTVDKFRMYTGSKLYYKNNWIERLYGSLELIGTPDEYVTVRTYYYTSNGKNELNSDLSGSGSLQFIGATSSGVPQGMLKIQGNNANWLGRLWIRMGGSNTTPGRECPNTNRYQICYVVNGVNFGGALSSFDYRAVRLSEYGALAVETGLNVALDVQNRGLFVDGNGQLRVEGTGVLSIANDVTFCGELRKIGTGLLALGGTARFGADGTSATSADGKNVFDVVEGSFKPLSSTCLDGVATTFRSGTKLVYDLDTTDAALRATGIRLVKTGSAFAPEADMETIPVELATSSERVTCAQTLALATGSETLCNNLKDKLSVARLPGARVELSVAETAEEGVWTLSANVCPKGFTLMFR